MERRSLVPLAAAIVIATAVASVAWVSVKTASHASIDVTGSAKRRIVSDLIEWDAGLEVRHADRVEATRALKKQVEKTLAYLKAQGLKDDEIRVSSVTMDEAHETEIVGSGDARVERTVLKGFDAAQTVSVRSTDVARVERISREVTSLLEEGVPVVSGQPQYLYTKLGELKIEMLAEASRDARTRAIKMIESAGSDARVGPLVNVDMGVINVNPANSTSTNWQGNNDTSSLEKDIITIVHVKYRID
ncbi:MAG: hypothetical protein A2138_15375 [Deltaproteobacteria bacterium RBG_16_71_12]|nr:MAG: hypothetical protein A2138_15375 [Deltaproteobacteria bacterium RBG_16_71_12]